MIQTRLKGMGVALITPFKEDESVDYDALMRLVDYLLQNNADFLCVLGTTAETPTLSEDEKKKIKKNSNRPWQRKNSHSIRSRWKQYTSYRRNTQK